MTDEFETFREVGIGVAGIRTQLALYAAVFGGVVVVASAAYGFMFNKLDRMEDTLARVETKIDGIADDTKQTRLNADEIKTALATNTQIKEWTPTKAESDLIAKLKDAFGAEVPTAYETVGAVVKYGTVEDLVQKLPPEQRKELEVGCMFANDAPAQFSTALLGTCAAVVNAQR